MISKEEHAKYVTEDNLATSDGKIYALCWHCKLCISSLDNVYSIQVRHYLVGAQHVYFHESCFTQIAGEDYLFES